MSTFFCLVGAAVDTLSTMMFSDAMSCSSYFSVVPRNLKFNKLSSISFLTASIFSSSLTLPNLFSNLLVSLTNVLRPLSLMQMLNLCVWHAPLTVPYLLATACHASNRLYPCVC